MVSCESNEKPPERTFHDKLLDFLKGCESNEKPPEPPKPYTPKHELEGTWIGYDKTDTKHEDYKLELKIDSDGNITFSPRPFPTYKPDIVIPYTYNGKTDINSIVYP